ncbi:MAG: hypothetical protein NWE89_11135 [Candidatus Bathyarchaeota archaeon]|nr:hypothetical protein [Candidatus Bathyarchaeota archaeon]
MSDQSKKPSTTDYMAGAVLSYGIVYFWIRVKTLYNAPWILAFVFFYLGGLLPSGMICKRTSRNQLPTGLKSAIISWIFTVVSLLAFTQGNQASFFGVLLVFFLLGGFTSGYITTRQRLKPRKPKREVEV